MFVISEKIKEVFRTYDTLVEEKSDTMPTDTASTAREFEERDYKERECRYIDFVKSILICVLCSMAMLVFVHYVLLSGSKASNRALGTDLGQQVYSHQAMTVVNDSRTIVNDVRQKNALVSERNRRVAADYLAHIQGVLEKRVEDSVKRINHLILDGVQGIESEIALFERSLSTLVSGVVDVTKHSIADIKANVNKALMVNDISKLDKAIELVQDETSQLIHNFEEMFNYQAGHLRDVISDKIQNVTDSMLRILTADSKPLRNMMRHHVAFCYKISRQNYDISTDLGKVMKAINWLQKATDTVNILSSKSSADESLFIVEAKYALSNELNNTKETFYTMMTNNDIFLSTTLKELAYQKHMDMRDFVYENYETVIRSFLPTVDRVTRNIKIVKDSHWQQVKTVIHPELADLSLLIMTKKKSFSTKDEDIRSKNTNVPASELKSTVNVIKTSNPEKVAKGISYQKNKSAVPHSELKSVFPFVANKLKEIATKVHYKNSVIHIPEFEFAYRSMANRFKDIAIKVNAFFKTKRENLIEGFGLSLVAIMDEKLPSISTWSLQNYVPSDACPITVEFQTYLKGIMDQYLSRSSSLKVIPSGSVD